MYIPLSKCAIALQVLKKKVNDEETSDEEEDQTSDEEEDHTSDEPPMQKEKMKVWKHS